jgi:hypothetical protein
MYNLLPDFTEIYEDNLRGHYMDSILDYINIDPKDFEVVNNFAKLLNAIGHCIFSYSVADKKIAKLEFDD